VRVLHKVLIGAVALTVVAGLGTIGSVEADTVAAKAETQTQPKVSTMPLRVMPLGDSVTLGTGSPTRSSYRAALALRLKRGGMEINYVGSQSGGRGQDIDHEGHGGWTIDQLAYHLDGWLAEARPDVVLLHAGTNNISRGESAYATSRKLSGMIDQIRAARPGAYIFVAKIIQSRVPRELARGRVYNRLVPALVARRNDPLIRVVDQSTVGGLDLHDRHHPNDFGYAKMAWNWYGAMARVFHTSGYTGRNPYTLRKTYRCLLRRVGNRHLSECRSWTLRTVKVKGRSVRVWQTLRPERQTYRVRVNGKLKKRTRTTNRWVGAGNLLDV
jgi:lysophospholipase L1-like esterase